ncbi:hypothetical protein C8F04DRAFT_918179, partial [Mycena alexandri]
IFQQKDVTIEHGQPLLFNDAYSDRYRKSAASHLGIKIVLHKIIEGLPTEVRPGTQAGLKLSAGLIVPMISNIFFAKLTCTLGRNNGRQQGAIHPDTAFMNSLDADALIPTGFVKVRPLTLQLFEYLNIFDAGDIERAKTINQACPRPS